jgi:hypothetical protein
MVRHFAQAFADLLDVLRVGLDALHDFP